MKTAFIYIDNSRQDEWEVLVAKNTASGFMQTFFWADFKRKTRWETFKLGILEKDKLVGGAIVMKYKYGPTSFLYIPEGPILPYENQRVASELFKKLIKEIEKLVTYWGFWPTTHLRIEPRLIKVPAYFKGFQKAPYNLEPKQTRMVDLSLSEDAILAQMKQKGRYNIRVAQRHGIEIVEDSTKHGLKTFLSLYHRTKKRDDFIGKPDAYFEKLYPLMREKKYGTFYIAYLGKKPLAASLALGIGNRMNYFYGASANTDREKMAPYLLHFYSMMAAKKQGFVWYDFWGIAKNEDNRNDSWFGFTQFKKQFGGQRVDFIGTYDLVYNKRLYQKYLTDSQEI